MNEQEFAYRVREITTDLANMLIEKNRLYGDAALNPLGVFGTTDPEERIRSRIDDKLKRIQTSDPNDQEDTTVDIMGYFILLQIAKGQRYRE